MHSSVLPVLRNLPTDHPRAPLLPGFKRRPLSLWPLFFLLIFACTLPFILLQLFKSARPDASRVETTGRVTQVELVTPGAEAGGQTAFVKYRFMAGQNLIYGNELIAPQEAPRVGDTLPISYNPKRTSDNYRVQSAPLLTATEGNETLSVVALSVMFVAFATFMVFQNTGNTPRDWLAWRRARGLYRNGEVTVGRVQFVRPVSALRSANNAANYEIVATYKVEGVRLLATTRCNNAWLVNQLAPEVEVVVAYDPRRPERAVILEPFAF